jgi:(p)ppGpp synthase/HD superfamily hydrolase
MINNWIKIAKDVAIEAHEGQLRRGGEPYVNHPIRVAEAVEDKLKPIAYCHDLIEDTYITLEDLKKLGLPPYVIVAVDLLTHKTGEPNMVYWKKMLVNSDAVIVKIADMKDNLASDPSECARKKYMRALGLFKLAGYNV